jgi:hypothetical protein
MSALHLLLPFGYLMVIVALSQVPLRMLEQVSEAAAAKNKNDALLSSLDSKSPPPLLLAVEIEKDIELRQREYGSEDSLLKKASNLPLTERPHSSPLPGPDQKQSEDIRYLPRSVYNIYVSNFTLVTALILQIAQFTLAYFFAKSMSYISPGKPWQGRFYAGALPGIAIINALTSLGACKRIYHAWAGNLEVLQWRKDPGALTLTGLGAFFTSPFVLLWPIIWIWSRSQ